MAQQTAVEWLGARLYDLLKLYPTKLEAVNFLTEQAKQMEKEQITNAYEHGQNNGYMYRDGGSNIINEEHYYNETFGKS